MIPEAVTDITSVSTLKTAEFTNKFGTYSYRTIKPELFFGFELKKMQDGRTIPFASPEKALLDFLYLYPEYNNEASMMDLRLDEDFLMNELGIERIKEYASQFGSKALDARLDTLLHAYGL